MSSPLETRGVLWWTQVSYASRRRCEYDGTHGLHKIYGRQWWNYVGVGQSDWAGWTILRLVGDGRVPACCLGLDGTMSHDGGRSC